MRGMAKFFAAERDELDRKGLLEHRGSYKIHRNRLSNGAVVLKVWGDNRGNYDYHYRFANNEKASEWLDRLLENERKVDKYNSDRKSEAERRKEAMRESVKVGTILHGSWGYDQTNCELYEVVERPSKAVAIIRPVATETVPGSEGFMSCKLRPVPGRHTGDPIRKMITAWGVKLHDSCTLTPCSADSEHYSSWYA